MRLLDRIFDRLLHRTGPPPLISTPQDPHMVFVTVPPDRMPDPTPTEHSPSVQVLLRELESAAAGLGIVGVAVRHGELTISASGPNADELFAALEPVLRRSPLLPKAYVLLRYGGLGAREVQISI